MIRRLLCLTLPLALAGCGSLWSDDDDGPAAPKPLGPGAPEIELQALWEEDLLDLDKEQRYRLSPQWVNGRIYAADHDDGRVLVLDAANGEVLWEVETDSPLSGGPGVGDGLVLAGALNGELLALDAGNGERKWSAQLSSEILSVPAADTGVVVAHTVDDKLYGLSAATGKELWRYESAVPVLSLQGTSSPVIYNGLVISGFANGKLATFDLLSGQLVWEASVALPRGRSELERMVDIDGDPVVKGGAVFAATYQGNLAALLLDNGRAAWRRDLSSHKSLAVDWERIYVVDDQDHLLAIDPRTGTALWRQEALQNRRLTAPALIADYLVTGDFEGYLHWINPSDGAIVGRTEVSDEALVQRPIITDRTLFVLDADGELRALQLK